MGFFASNLTIFSSICQTQPNVKPSLGKRRARGGAENQVVSLTLLCAPLSSLRSKARWNRPKVRYIKRFSKRISPTILNSYKSFTPDLKNDSRFFPPKILLFGTLFTWFDRAGRRRKQTTAGPCRLRSLEHDFQASESQTMANGSCIRLKAERSTAINAGDSQKW